MLHGELAFGDFAFARDEAPLRHRLIRPLKLVLKAGVPCVHDNAQPLVAQRLAEERAAAVAAGEVDEDELSEDEQRQLTEKQQLQELIDQKPAEVAMLIKTWLSEDE